MHLPITHPPPRQTQSTPPQYSPLYRTHSVPTLRWPNPSPGGSDFGFWLQSAPPRASPDRIPPPRQTQSTPPQWCPIYRTRGPPALRWPNPSSGSSDLVFGPQPPLPPRVGERAAPPTSPPHPRHSATFPHRLPLPFHTAHSKSSHRAQFCGFWPLAPSPASYLRTRSPTTTTTSSTSRHRLPPSPSAAVSHGSPEIEPPRSISWFLAPSPLSHFAFANAQPHHHHHHLIHVTPPPPPVTLHCHFTWRAQNRAMALGFVAFGPPPV